MRKRKYIEPFVHALIWAGGFIIFITLVQTLGPFKKFNGTLIWPVTVGTLINMALFYVPSLVLIPRLSRTKKTLEFLLLTFGVLLILTLGETLIDYFFFVYYYSDFSEPFHSQLITNSILNLIVLSVSLGYGFTKNWIASEKLRKSMKQEMLSAELNFLKTQLNPHFLFNVLNMAFSSASRHGDEQTADIIERLSGLMRYMLYESNVDKVEMEKEISYISHYLELQKMRFSSDLPVNVTFDIQGSFAGLRIAPLILITFIENAFKHGTKLEQEAEIGISMTFTEQRLVFIVQNQIFNATNDLDPKGSGIGLENVRKRLDLLYPSKYRLDISDDGHLYIVTLELNLDY